MKDNIAPGSVAKTDGLTSYLGAPDVTHEPHVVGPMAAHIILPAIHRVFSNLKTWALGVYHGVRRKHLGAYLDEFIPAFAGTGSSASIGANHGTPPSPRCSASRPRSSR